MNLPQISWAFKVTLSARATPESGTFAQPYDLAQFRLITGYPVRSWRSLFEERDLHIKSIHNMRQRIAVEKNTQVLMPVAYGIRSLIHKLAYKMVDAPTRATPI